LLNKLEGATRRYLAEIAEIKRLLQTAPSQMLEVTLYNKFPPELREHLRFFNNGDHVRVEPKHYLGKQLFAKIATVVRELGGEYVSAGRDSHFRFKKGFGGVLPPRAEQERTIRDPSQRAGL